MRGGEHAHVHRDGFLAAEPLQAALLQHAHELDLRAGRHVADLIEEDGAVVGLLEAADAPVFGAGKGAAFVAEQLAFEQGLGDGGAVDGDEGRLGAVAVLVNGAGDEFLAGAGLAADQDVDGLGGDAANLLVDRLHGAAVADQGGAGGPGRAQFDLLGHHAPAGNAFGDERKQLGHLEGLEQVIVGAGFGGLDGALGGAVGGHHDDGQARLGDVQVAHQVQPVQARQLHVGDDDIQLFVLGPRQAGVAARLDKDFIALLAEEPAQGHNDARIVLDQQNPGCTGHCRPMEYTKALKR